MQSKDFKQLPNSNKLYTLAIDKYDGNAPAKVLFYAAKIKCALEKFQEAEEPFSKALEKYAENAPARVLLCAAKTKHKLGKFQEAEELFTKSNAV